MRWVLIGIWSFLCFLAYAILAGGFGIIDLFLGHVDFIDGIAGVLQGIGNFIILFVWLAGCLVIALLAKLTSFSLAQQTEMQQRIREQQMRQQNYAQTYGYGGPGSGQTPPPMPPGAGPVIDGEYRHLDDTPPR